MNNFLLLIKKIKILLFFDILYKIQMINDYNCADDV